MSKKRDVRGGECVEDIPRTQFWPIRLYVLCLYADIDLEIGVSMLTHRHKTETRIELVVTLYVYMRVCAKKSHFTFFLVKRETHPKFMRTLTFAM